MKVYKRLRFAPLKDAFWLPAGMRILSAFYMFDVFSKKTFSCQKMELSITRWDVPLPKTLFLTSEIDAPLSGIHIIIVFLKNPYPYPNQGVHIMDTLWRKRIHIWINASFASIMFFRFSCVLTASFYQRGFFYNLYPKTIENVVRVDVFEAKRNDIWIKQVRQLFRFFASTPRFVFLSKKFSRTKK